MNFIVYDVNEFCGYIHFTTEDYEQEFCADIDDCYDYEREEWNDEAVRSSAEKQLREQFGEDARILW